MLPELDALGMDDITAGEIETLARSFNGFGQRTRLAILLGFAHDNSTTEIADALGISRAGLTNHLSKMVDAQLLRSKKRGYELTYLGRYFANQIEGEKDRLIDAAHIIAITRHQLGEVLSEEVNLEYVDDDEWERILDRELWETVEPELDALLDGQDLDERYRAEST